MTRRQRIVEMMGVVIAQLDVADTDLGINVDQRGRQIEGSLQRFELVGAMAPFRCIRLWVRLARYLRKHNWRVKRLHMLECPLEHILRAFNIVIPGHPGQWAQLQIGISDFKSIFHSRLDC